MLTVLDEGCGERAVHAIRVGHRRTLAGAVRVGLEDFDALSEHAIRPRCRFVVGYLRALSVAEYPLVHERKMADVEEVLDYSRRARLHEVRARHHHIVRGVVEQLEA